MVENDSIGWYVAKTYRQERKLKAILASMGIAHFVPFHQVVKEINGKRKKVEEPFVNGLIFVRGNKKSCIELINEYGYPMRYLRDFSTRSLLRVPDNLKRGDRVRVVAGTFAGIEGELIRIAGHRRVVVRLENLFSIATVFIPGGYLEKICDR